jgi:hypothetical protein
LYFVLCVLAGLTASAAFAQIPSDEQSCINGVNKAAMNVAKAQGKENSTCVKNAVKGKEPAPAACVTADEKQKVAKKAAKTFDLEAKSCGVPPAFGYMSAAAANNAAINQEAAIVDDMYGVDVDGALLVTVGNSDAASCQSGATKNLEKVLKTALKSFQKCKKAGLNDGSITDAAGLDACLDDVAADSKLTKAIDKMSDKFDKDCDGLSLATLFPGLCAGAPDYPDCLSDLARCRVCRMVNAMDGLLRDCDAFDDETSNASCIYSVTTTSTTTTTTLAGPACGAADFLDLTGAAGPGVNDPDNGQPLVPQVSATCDSDELIVTSNDIPHYTFTQLTPTQLNDAPTEVRVPRSPSLAANWTEISCLGTVGIAVNGVKIFGPNEAAMPDPFGDPIANGIMDECLGHHGDHHYHGMVAKCLTQASVGEAEPWTLPDLPTNVPSAVIGYAYDGFPIYGSLGCEDAGCTSVIEYKSGWENSDAYNAGCASSAACAGNDVCLLTVVAGVETTACIPNTYAWDSHTYVSKAGSEYLDVCNGHTGPAGDYHYHTTSTFPYILGCFSGTPAGGAGGGTGPGVPSPCPGP